MKIGFIGAGKAGNSLARHFAEHNILISGFYSKTYEHAKQAADYTHSAAFLSVYELVAESDIIFVTTSDGIIQAVWDSIKEVGQENLAGKTVCHMSGSISSEIFNDADILGVHSCSAHPMQAISSTHTDLSDAFFTLEGMKHGVSQVSLLLKACGNPLEVINSAFKATYHAAAVTASNLMVGLAQMAIDLLQQCGFNSDNAQKMLAPLMKNNLDSILEKGPIEALTGPVERGDIETIRTHLNNLDGQHKDIYLLLSHQILEIARKKHPETDYDNLKDELEEQK